MQLYRDGADNVATNPHYKNNYSNVYYFWRYDYNRDALCDCPSKSNDINSMEEQVIWFVQSSKQQGVRSGGMERTREREREREKSGETPSYEGKVEKGILLFEKTWRTVQLHIIYLEEIKLGLMWNYRFNLVITTWVKYKWKCLSKECGTCSPAVLG